ncbi:MAG TPA: ThuA domain-containing protein [Acidimicrobiia bacterium]|nr:ThuA domain-containing protein [Acidimicrobiia bacterium]
MAANLILTGGPGHHPYAVTSERLAEILAGEGIASTVTEDIESGLGKLAAGAFDLLTVNALRWRMDAPKYAAERPQWAFSLSPAGRAAIVDHVARGGAVLAVHTATICFDDWPEWGDIVGARWVWGESAHPDLGPVRVAVRPDAHEIVSRASDFQTVDEIYSRMWLAPDVRALATGHWEGADHPLLWARTVGPAGARSVYDALGHDERSYDQPVHREILRRAARWLVEGSGT